MKSNTLEVTQWIDINETDMLDTNGGGILSWVIIGGVCAVISCVVGSCNGRQRAENEIELLERQQAPLPTPTPAPTSAGITSVSAEYYQALYGN